MKKTIKKLLIVFLTIVVFVTTVVPIGASAVTPKNLRKYAIGTLTTSYNVKRFYNSRGWSWDAKTKTLTLNNCRINTKSLNVVKLPNNSKIVLKGTNILCAKRTAIWGYGNLRISGKGKLIVRSSIDTAITTNGSLTIAGGTTKAYSYAPKIAAVIVDKSLYMNGGILAVKDHKSVYGIVVSKNIVANKGILSSASKVANGIEIYAGLNLKVNGGKIYAATKGKNSYGVWVQNDLKVFKGLLSGLSYSSKGYGIGVVAKRNINIIGGTVKARGHRTGLAAWNRIISPNNRSKAKVKPSLYIGKKMKVSGGVKINKTSVSQRYHGVGAGLNDYITEKFYLLTGKGFTYDFNNIKFTHAAKIVSIYQYKK